MKRKTKKMKKEKKMKIKMKKLTGKTRKIKAGKATATKIQKAAGVTKKHKKIAQKILDKMEKVEKKKRGRPRKNDVAPKKRGRPKKVVKEGKQDKLHKVAKLGKRKYKQAVEQMAMEKINKKIRRKQNGMRSNAAEHGPAVSVKTMSYEKHSKIAAGPNVKPEGIKKEEKKKDAPTIPIIDQIKNRLREKGYRWDEATFKIIEKTPAWWTVEFKDKKYGKVTSSSNIMVAKQEEEIANKKVKKDPKVKKAELDRYVRKLKSHGHNPKNVKVVENKKDYFTIEFQDGVDGPLTTCSHARGWE